MDVSIENLFVYFVEFTYTYSQTPNHLMTLQHKFKSQKGHFPGIFVHVQICPKRSLSQKEGDDKQTSR